MKILLMCANGLSTGILMNKMNQWAEQNNEDLEVKAIPIDDYLSVYKDYDVLLVGPQMRYKIKDVRKGSVEGRIAFLHCLLFIKKICYYINSRGRAIWKVEWKNIIEKIRNIIKEVKRMIKEGK